MVRILQEAEEEKGEEGASLTTGLSSGPPVEALLAFENSEGAGSFLGWALGPEQEPRSGSTQNGAEHPGYKDQIGLKNEPFVALSQA